jgi:spore coat polysaccharide biosynthesis predicted glycosyltransferase SpsG
MEDMTPQEVTYVLENYSKYLTYDIKRNFEEKREKDLKESPFDAIINDDLGINNE